MLKFLDKIRDGLMPTLSLILIEPSSRGIVIWINFQSPWKIRWERQIHPTPWDKKPINEYPDIPF